MIINAGPDDISQNDEIRRGWPIMIVCFLGAMTSVIAFPFYVIGPLIPMFQAHFGWDRTAIVAATAFFQLGLVFGMPLSGKFIDRFGGRIVALVSYGMTVLVFIALANLLDTLDHLRLGYLALGLLCGGASTVPFTLLIGKWFVRKRGLALGIALAGTGLASFIAPNLAEAVGGGGNWRMVLYAVAGFIAIGIPVVLIGYREPTSDAGALNSTSQQPSVPVSDTTWRQLIVDQRFILLGAILVLGGFFISSLVVHFVPLLIDEGLTPKRAAQIASLNGLAMIFGRLTIGWLLDRYSAVWLGTAMFMIAALGCLMFVIGGAAVAPITVIAMGFMIGAEIDLLSYLVLRYFKIEDYGLVYGYLYGIYMAGCIASPWIVGFLIDKGGYSLTFIAAAGMFAVIAMMFPLLDKTSAGPAGRSAKGKMTTSSF
jgi:MFS family permease